MKRNIASCCRTDGCVGLPRRVGLSCNGGGKPVLVRGVSRDITARKLAEEEANQRRNEVAHLSRVTTLGEISGSLAHELNQPLGAMIVNTEAAELHLQSPDAQTGRGARHSRRHSEGRLARRGNHPRNARVPAAEGAGNATARSWTSSRDEAVKLIRADAAARKTSVGIEIPARPAPRDGRSRPSAAGPAQPAGQRHGCHEQLPRGRSPHHHPGDTASIRTLSKSPSATRASAFRRESWIGSSPPSTPRSTAVWAWVCPSAVPSLRLMAARSQSQTTPIEGQPRKFTLPVRDGRPV